MFIDRHPEIEFLNSLLERQHSGPAQLVLLYGRRRVGKTSLLRFWPAQSGLPVLYWSAEKEPAALQRRKLYAALLGMPVNRAPIFESWADVWDAAAELIGGQKNILILDELPYAAEADPAMLSALQHAWDHHSQPSDRRQGSHRTNDLHPPRNGIRRSTRPGTRSHPRRDCLL
jgi:uncharacterized protein